MQKDPEWNPQARAGEIMSQLSQIGEKLKELVTELVKPEPRVLARGVLEVRAVNESFIASFQDVPAAECAGISIPPRPGSQTRGVGRNPYEAVRTLADEMQKGESLG